jgi:hypothetical protein
MNLESFVPVGSNGWHGKKPVMIGWGGIRLFPMTEEDPVVATGTKLSRNALKPRIIKSAFGEDGCG